MASKDMAAEDLTAEDMTTEDLAPEGTLLFRSVDQRSARL
jgi:hypothetical protein